MSVLLAWYIEPLEGFEMSEVEYELVLAKDCERLCTFGDRRPGSPFDWSEVEGKDEKEPVAACASLSVAAITGSHDRSARTINRLRLNWKDGSVPD